MIILITIAIVTLWTVGSIWYAFIHLGDKNHQGKDPWYIWLLGAPVLAIAWVLGKIIWLKRKLRG